MSQEEMEWVVSLTGVFHIIVQALCFCAIWKVFFPIGEGFRSRKYLRLCGHFAALTAVNLFISIMPGIPSWARYPASAFLVLAYVFAYRKKHLEKAVFVLLLFYNLHGLSFLISNSVYQCGIEMVFQRMDPTTDDYLNGIYQNAAWGQMALVVVYGLLLFAMASVLRKVVKLPWDMGWQDMVFLSSLNVVGGMLARIVLELSMVKMDQGVFLLFDEKKDMTWKIPLIAVLLYLGEVSVIYIFQQYGKLQQERHKQFVEGQQLKAIQRRLEEAEGFYGSIRAARHEMKNHMASIKGLVARENYQEAERYMEKLEQAMETLDYQFSTGNPVTDVIINDKYRKAAALGIDFQVRFRFGAKDGISVFDMGILLNNLLDNAIEACSRLEGNQRYISLSLKKKERFLLVEVENSFDGEVKWEAGSPIPATRKQQEPLARLEHGIGLKNVKKIAERYLGVMDIKIKGTVFQVTVMLQQQVVETVTKQP